MFLQRRRLLRRRLEFPPPHRFPWTAPGPGAYTSTSTGGGYGWLPGASVLPPQVRPVHAHFMDTWQPWYSDVGIRGLLSSLDTFCRNNINLCGGRLTGTIWTTYLATGGIGAIRPASQRLLGRLINALLAPKAVAYAATNDDMLGRLPPFTEGGKTSGIFVNDGNWTEVTSGY